MNEKLITAFAELLRALSNLAWPIVIGIFLWALYPAIKEILAAFTLQKFTFKGFGFEISMKEAAENAKRIIQDLSEKASQSNLEHILWVEELPKTKYFEIKAIRNAGISVDVALSTEVAMKKLAIEEVKYDLIISSMYRREQGIKRPNAGLALIKKLKRADINIPIIIYCSSINCQRTSKEVQSEGQWITYSPITLFNWLIETPWKNKN